LADLIAGSTATALRSAVEGISQAQAALLFVAICFARAIYPQGVSYAAESLSVKHRWSNWASSSARTRYFTLTTTSVKSSSNAPLQKLVASRLNVSIISAALPRMFSFPIRVTVCSPNSTPLELRASIKPSV